MLTITPNNLFVIYAMLFFAVVCIAIYFLLKKKILLRNILITVFFMAGFSFALVPLYNVFCEVTGLNGKVDYSVSAATPEGIDNDREITIEFVVNHNEQMPWQFKPKHISLKVHPGQVYDTGYFAKNITKKTMIAQAIPSIAPARARKYLKKVQCFCFNSQKLGPGQSQYLDLRFYIDQSLPKDIKRLTLSYTLFDITKDS